MKSFFYSQTVTRFILIPSLSLKKELVSREEEYRCSDGTGPTTFGITFRGGGYG